MCFFFKRKTAYERRISYLSSDVCSSDLEAARRRGISGVLVEEVTRGSRAERNGLRKGDVVVAASSGGFGDLPSFRASVDDAPQSLVLRILRGGGQGSLPMRWGAPRSAARRVGQACVRPRRSRWPPVHKKKKT